MNVGLYQSASALTALERWQDLVSQNIASSQQTGYRKRTISFSTQAAGELQTNLKARIGSEGATPMLFPKTNAGISFTNGELQPTRRDLDVAIQGEGFFEVQRPDGSKAYTRSGVSDSGSPIVFSSSGGAITFNQDGTINQGSTALGKLAVKKFDNNAQLTPVAGGFFVPAPGSPAPQSVTQPGLLQGYLEGSNATPLREMVDLVLISRAYEANQKIITTVDQQMQKTFDALG
jgi:flagellar basal-body rod protein FlgF